MTSGARAATRGVAGGKPRHSTEARGGNRAPAAATATGESQLLGATTMATKAPTGNVKGRKTGHKVPEDNA